MRDRVSSLLNELVSSTVKWAAINLLGSCWEHTDIDTSGEADSVAPYFYESRLTYFSRLIFTTNLFLWITAVIPATAHMSLISCPRIYVVRITAWVSRHVNAPLVVLQSRVHWKYSWQLAGPHGHYEWPVSLVLSLFRQRVYDGVNLGGWGTFGPQGPSCRYRWQLEFQQWKEMLDIRWVARVLL